MWVGDEEIAEGSRLMLLCLPINAALDVCVDYIGHALRGRPVGELAVRVFRTNYSLRLPRITKFAMSLQFVPEVGDKAPFAVFV